MLWQCALASGPFRIVAPGLWLSGSLHSGIFREFARGARYHAVGHTTTTGDTHFAAGCICLGSFEGSKMRAGWRDPFQLLVGEEPHGLMTVSDTQHPSTIPVLTATGLASPPEFNPHQLIGNCCVMACQESQAVAELVQPCYSSRF